MKNEIFLMKKKKIITFIHFISENKPFFHNQSYRHNEHTYR